MTSLSGEDACQLLGWERSAAAPDQLGPYQVEPALYNPSSIAYGTLLLGELLWTCPELPLGDGGEVWLLTPLVLFSGPPTSPSGAPEPFVVGHKLKYILP